MRTQAQQILDSTTTLDEAEAMAKLTFRKCHAPDTWTATYTFADGSQLHCRRMPAASEEDSSIRALPATESVS